MITDIKRPNSVESIHPDAGFYSLENVDLLFSSLMVNPILGITLRMEKIHRVGRGMIVYKEIAPGEIEEFIITGACTTDEITAMIASRYREGL